MCEILDLVSFVQSLQENSMGHHTIVAIPHDHMAQISNDPDFGKRLVNSIVSRRNPNTPLIACAAHTVQLGPQFHSNDTIIVSVEDGTITQLTIEEQIYLEASLRRFRKKKQVEGSETTPS